MAFIGNTVQTQGFIPATDTFSGNGSTTAFTLSRPVASVQQVFAVISNVDQDPNTAYTVSGNTITFTSAPPSGTNNIYVRYTSLITQVIAPSQGTVGTAQLGTITNIASGNSSLTLQTGTSPTTAMTIDTSQKVTLPNDASISGLTVGKGGGSQTGQTALGASAFASNSSGTYGTAIGYYAGLNNTTGQITALGSQSLYTNTSGTANTGLGISTLYYNSTGGNNTAVGTQSLFSNTTASNNTAVGYQAGYTSTIYGANAYFGNGAGYNCQGANNTYVGSASGPQGSASSGNGNNGFGINALASVTSGTQNTALGYQSAYYITTGSKNSILGSYNGNQGGLDIRTASNYIVLSDGDGNPRIYHNGSQWYIPSAPLLSPYIYSTTGAGAGTVVVGTDGNLFRSSSSARYKKDIVDARFGLSDLLKLRAVNYEGNGDQDTDKLLGGLIAEEVDAAGLHEFVIYDEQNRPDAIHYAQMVSLCVKAIQELNAKVTALEAQLGAK